MMKNGSPMKLLLAKDGNKHFGEFYVASQTKQCKPKWCQKVFEAATGVPQTPTTCKSLLTLPKEMLFGGCWGSLQAC